MATWRAKVRSSQEVPVVMINAATVMGPSLRIGLACDNVAMAAAHAPAANLVAQEGIRIPSVRWTPEVEVLFVAASRTPEERRGDLDAQLGANRLGVRRWLELAPARVALWDRYGGSMPSGWTRWILEQFEFPFDCPSTPLRAGAQGRPSLRRSLCEST